MMDNTAGGNKSHHTSDPLGKRWLFPLLRDQATSTLVSIFTLIVMVILTFFVARWTISQDQAHLFIHKQTWEVSPDLRDWHVEVVIDNDGPPTATDLTVGARLAVSPHIRLTHLAILHEGSSVELIRAPEGGTVLWDTYLDGTPQSAQIRFLDYETPIERLLVGDRLVIKADLITEPPFGQRLFSTLQNRDHVPLANPHGAGPEYFEYAYQDWVMLHLRAFFIHDVTVSGNKVVVTKSDLWKPQPTRFR